MEGNPLTAGGFRTHGITKVDHPQAMEKLINAKVSMMRRSVFLSTLTMEFEHFLTTDIPTAGTDYLSVAYNPDMIMELSLEEVVFVVAHEIWHIAYDHLERGQGKDPALWNIAGDYVINFHLKRTGFTLPTWVLYDPSVGDLSTEEVYENLRKNPPVLPHNLKDQYALGSFGQAKLPDNSSRKTVARQKIQKAIIKAKIVSDMSSNGKNQGDIPGEILRVIDALVNPVIPWNEYLAKFVSEYVKDDYTYRRPNKRFYPEYLPSMQSPSIGTLMIAIDTSGSITDTELRDILTEIEGIRTMMNPRKLIIFDADSRIHNEFHVERNQNLLDLKFRGGGGTSFWPVLKKAEEENPTVLLYFTDLYAETISQQFNFPILWVCYADHAPQACGETIYYHHEHAQKYRQ